MGDSRPDHGSRLTRRQLLVGGGSVFVALAAAGVGTYLIEESTSHPVSPNDFSTVPAASVPLFHSRPDLRIAGIAIDVDTGATAPGLIFLAPYGSPSAQEGALIVDRSGQPVWMNPVRGLETDNLRVQTYDGQPVLTWWEGTIEYNHGVGSYVIANDRYEPIKHVQAGNGLRGDLHEFLLTTRGTALFTSYVVTTADLSSVGGSKRGRIQDSIFQELDIATGRVLLEWHSLDHIALAESYWPVDSPWDYVHLNSIDVDVADENSLLVSSRNTRTIYKVDRSSGDIIWRLGGKHSDFALGTGARFAWQHDARSHANGVVTMFDNEGSPFVGDTPTRALVLEVDEKRMTATLRQEYRHPLLLQSSSKGNAQILPNGNVFVGWGGEPFVSEFSPSGELLFDARLGIDYVSYRAFRVPWSATGVGQPSVAARRSAAHTTELWASWNGDTQVARWLVLGGGATGALEPLGSFPRSGFETAIELDALPQRVMVRGLDRGGVVLGESLTVSV